MNGETTDGSGHRARLRKRLFEGGGEALLDHEGLMVITNNINVANHLRIFPSIEVVIAGGVVRGPAPTMRPARSRPSSTAARRCTWPTCSTRSR